MTDLKLTPPPELVRQWMERTEYDEHTWFYESYIAEQAAQWGADQELEACCEWLKRKGWEYCPDPLRASRRPKPPSLKEEALGGLDQLAVRLTEAGVAVDLDTIRRALEGLPND